MTNPVASSRTTPFRTFPQGGEGEKRKTQSSEPPAKGGDYTITTVENGQETVVFQQGGAPADQAKEAAAKAAAAAAGKGKDAPKPIPGFDVAKAYQTYYDDGEGYFFGTDEAGMLNVVKDMSAQQFLLFDHYHVEKRKYGALIAAGKEMQEKDLHDVEDNVLAKFTLPDQKNTRAKYLAQAIYNAGQWDFFIFQGTDVERFHQLLEGVSKDRELLDMTDRSFREQFKEFAASGILGYAYDEMSGADLIKAEDYFPPAPEYDAPKIYSAVSGGLFRSADKDRMIKILKGSPNVPETDSKYFAQTKEHLVPMFQKKYSASDLPALKEVTSMLPEWAKVTTPKKDEAAKPGAPAAAAAAQAAAAPSAFFTNGVATFYFDLESAQGAKFDPITAAGIEFNMNPSNCRFIPAKDPSVLTRGNGKNEIAFVPAGELQGKMGEARVVRNADQSLKEVDLVFAREAFTDLPPSAYLSRSALAMQALGTIAGLTPQAGAYGIMSKAPEMHGYDRVSADGKEVYRAPYLAPAEMKRLGDVYAFSNPNYFDIALSRGHGDPNGENVMATISGDGAAYDGGRGRWDIVPGKKYEASFSLENFSGKAQKVRTRFYLTNDLKAAKDKQVLIGTAEPSAENAAWSTTEMQVEVELPAVDKIPAGFEDCYLRVEAEALEAPPTEANALNNAIYFPLHIKRA